MLNRIFKKNEKIVERLLSDKHITVSEATILLTRDIKIDVSTGGIMANGDVTKHEAPIR